MEDFLFGNKNDINAWQECARALVIFAYGMVAIRAAGRRIFGKWSAIDFIVSIIVGSALGRVMTGGAQPFATLAACTLLLGLHWCLVHYAVRHRFISLLLEGHAVVLATDGKLNKAKALRHNITNADLDEALRQEGCEQLAHTRLVTLEPSGKITVVPKK